MADFNLTVLTTPATPLLGQGIDSLGAAIGFTPVPASSKTDSIGFSVLKTANIASPEVIAYWVAPYAGTLSSWNIITDVAGDMVIDIWKAASAIPTVADSITAAAQPSLAAARYANSTTMTAWTTTFTANDVFAFVINSMTTIRQPNFYLVFNKV